jgi:hypothetical protein
MPQKLCIDDAQYIGAAQESALATLARGVTELAVDVILSKWRRDVAKQINDMKQEIADRQVALAEAAHGHASSFYGKEAALVADAMGIPKVTPEYALSTGWTNFAVESNAYGRGSWLKAAREMCMVPSRCDAGRWESLMRNNEVDTGNYAMRQAEVRSQALNDVRFKRQLDAIGLGQGRFGSGAGYSQAAGTIATNVGDAIMNSVNSAAGLVGYLTGRKETRPSWEYGYTPRVGKAETMRENGNVLIGGPQQSNFDPVEDYFKYSAVKKYDTGTSDYAGYRSSEPDTTVDTPWGGEARYYR